MVASQASTASEPGRCSPGLDAASRARSRCAARQRDADRDAGDAITRVTSGPGDRDPELDPGRVGVPVIRATPPNSHRSMPGIPIPLRIGDHGVAELVQQDRARRTASARDDREQVGLGCPDCSSPSWIAK